MEVDSSYSLTLHAEVMLDPVCNVPVSGESLRCRPRTGTPSHLLETHRRVIHLVVQEVGRVYTLTQLFS